MSASIAAAFDAAMREENAKQTPSDLLQFFPSAPPTTSDAFVRSKPLSECRFYDDFAMIPDEANKRVKLAVKEAIETQGKQYVTDILNSRKHHALRRRRRYDFRLNAVETMRLEQQGFVVTERLSAESFAEVYYRLYSDDMPVYITSDSVLHAWHRSFDAFLTELEEEELVPLLESVLDDVQAAVTHSSAVPTSVVKDVTMFFTVAQQLLQGEMKSTDHSVASILTAIEKETMTSIQIFGAGREVDCSLFKPRGHYTKSEILARFFRSMMWLGTVDLRVDGTENPTSELYQLQCACYIVHLLVETKAMERVDAFYRIISVIAGDGYGADSITPMQLRTLLVDRDIAADYLSAEGEPKLRDLQDEIANQGLGTQAITGHPLTESLAAASSGSQSTRLPTSFALMGQQFVWSAFVFSKIVYDQVKVPRRLPSAVDVAFALFGNNAAAGEIAKRMTSSPKIYDDYVAFRDGLPYTSNLLAVRKVIDAELATADPTTCSLALLWQLALRELSSASASDARVFQSDSWKRRTMNTQIASFAQLRHDTILYAKQSFTMGTRCEYAAGFVDPYPAFWLKMQQLGERAREVLTQLKQLKNTEDEESPLQYKARNFFENFSDVMRKIGEIATIQATKQPLNEEQDHFIKSVMEERHGSGGSRYLGWYPSLFYTHRKDSGEKDHIVVDIHTDIPSVEHGDPGGILHLGVGDVNMGFFVVDDVMYAGPVFSHYEFVTPINERLNDEEFSQRLDKLHAPKWVSDAFLVSK